MSTDRDEEPTLNPAQEDPTEVSGPLGLDDGQRGTQQLFRELDRGGAGNYRPIRELASGGMGVVFLAEQTAPVQRKVALKVIKLGMDTQDVVARFESERQALAVMDHPNIARVYDAGATRGGRPYFVMEFVRGKPLLEYCDANSLSIERRLELFVDICRGVQHAHQKGVIHRDLKPSNILVSDDGDTIVPKIIDFGVAKATAKGELPETSQTVDGAWVGTPAYMSPEQAGMSGVDIDTRTDIYSLGVVLYELLTGHQPFDLKAMASSLAEVQHIIQTLDPSIPSKRITELEGGIEEVARLRGTDGHGLRRELRGDLDWIVMKALDKDRARRYETANGLALDVQRFMKDEPIEARPPSKAYRALKFVRRNRLGVAMAAALSVALVAGMAGTGVGFLRANREAIRATAVSDFLKNMLSQVDPHRAQGREITVREVLDTAAETVEDSFRETPLVEAEIRKTIADMYHFMGHYAESEAQVHRVIELYRRELGDEHELTLESLNLLATTYFRTNRLDEAMEIFQELEVVGADHPETLTVQHNVASSYLAAKDYERAEPLLRKVLEGRRRVEGPEGIGTLATQGNLARLLGDTGRFDEAEPLLAEAFEIRLRTQGKRHPRTLISQFNLGDLIARSGRPADAEPLIHEAWTGFSQVLGADHVYTIEAATSLVETWFRLGRDREARQLGLDTHPVIVEVLGDESEESARMVRLLVEHYEAQGQVDEATRWRARLPG